MPASGKTPNLDLPLYKPLDTVSMLVTFNGAMNALDTIVQELKTEGIGNTTNISNLETEIATMKADIEANIEAISSLNTSVNNIKGYNKIGVPIRQVSLTAGPGVYYIYQKIIDWGGKNITGTLAFDISSLSSVTQITVESQIYYQIASTPENFLNLKDNIVYRMGGILSVNQKAGATEAVFSGESYLLRQNSITYFLLPAWAVKTDADQLHGMFVY